MFEDLSPEEKLYFYKIKKYISLHGSLSCDGFRDAYLERRFRARIGSLRLNTLREYYKYIEDKGKEEMLILWNTIAINVTRFFRNVEVYGKLEKEILPNLSRTRLLLVWSAGSSVGEEAYSVAMICRELTKKGIYTNVKIIGTDIDEDAMNKGREGIYKKEDFQEMPEKYFKYLDDLGNDRFQVKEELKKIVSFQRNDLLKDPPLKNMDLILCRNTIIYFDKPAQEKIFMKFYGALNEGGYLILGGTESLSGGAEKLFKYIDIPTRVYRKLP